MLSTEKRLMYKTLILSQWAKNPLAAFLLLGKMWFLRLSFIQGHPPHDPDPHFWPHSLLRRGPNRYCGPAAFPAPVNPSAKTPLSTPLPDAAAHSYLSSVAKASRGEASRALHCPLVLLRPFVCSRRLTAPPQTFVPRLSKGSGLWLRLLLALTAPGPSGDRRPCPHSLD